MQVLLSLVSGLGLASTVGTSTPIPSLEEIYLDASEIPEYAREAIAIASHAKLVVNFPNLRK